MPVSRTHSLTQTHALFLEWLSLGTARRVGRYSDSNGNAGSRPHTPAPLEADCREVFGTGQILLATLGHPLFAALPQADARQGGGVVLLPLGRRGGPGAGHH